MCYCIKLSNDTTCQITVNIKGEMTKIHLAKSLIVLLVSKKGRGLSRRLILSLDCNFSWTLFRMWNSHTPQSPHWLSMALQPIPWTNTLQDMEDVGSPCLSCFGNIVWSYAEFNRLIRLYLCDQVEQVFPWLRWRTRAENIYDYRVRWALFLFPTLERAILSKWSIKRGERVVVQVCFPINGQTTTVIPPIIGGQGLYTLLRQTRKKG